MSYDTLGESITIAEKKEILKYLDREDLIKVFEGWEPKRYRQRRKAAPLDQRVNINVSKDEKATLLKDVEAMKSAGEKISMSQFIRNKAIGNIDMEKWRDSSERAMEELKLIKDNKKELTNRRLILRGLIENTDDKEIEDIGFYNIEINEINDKLSKLKSTPIKRDVRLTGRVTFAEAETIKWRAQRLAISASDYLRFVLFNQVPGTEADKHLTYETRMRMYISVLEVAKNGFGDVPTIYNCRNCIHYLQEIDELKKEIRRLRMLTS